MTVAPTTPGFSVANQSGPVLASPPRCRPRERARDFANWLARRHPALARLRFSEAVARTTPALLERFCVPGLQCSFLFREHEPRTTSLGLMDASTRAPMRDSTRFCVGSLSKPFASILVLTLARDGVLGLDESLVEELGDLLPHATSAQRNGLTPRMLLSHASGLACVHPPRMLNPPSLEAWLRSTDITFDAPPASRTSYTSLGAALLEVAIQRRTGSSFSQLMQRLVFAPLGHVAMGYERSAAQAAPTSHAAPVSSDHDERGITTSTPPTLCEASSGLVASTADICRVLRDAIFTDRLLPAELSRLLITPQPPELATAAYTLGLHLYKHTDARSIAHGGHRPGHRSFLAVVPSARAICCVATNGEQGSQVLRPLTGFFRAITVGD